MDKIVHDPAKRELNEEDKVETNEVWLYAHYVCDWENYSSI